jgi:hypothetical protein
MQFLITNQQKALAHKGIFSFHSVPLGKQTLFAER